jgi:hypothetical protein
MFDLLSPSLIHLWWIPIWVGLVWGLTIIVRVLLGSRRKRSDNAP